MKGDGPAWASELRKLMRDLGFTPCRANGDVWTRVDVDILELVEMEDSGLPVGERYYEYVLMHVDNLMVDSHIPEQVMHYISKTYRLNKAM